MRALTVLQPWAGLILLDEKRVETRSWYTKIRGTVAIHAGLDTKWLRKFSDLSEHWACTATGFILGTVEIVDCILLDHIAESEYRGLANEKERKVGDWSSGRYGFILQNPILFDEPIPAKGKQGWWNWNQ